MSARRALAACAVVASLALVACPARRAAVVTSAPAAPSPAIAAPDEQPYAAALDRYVTSFGSGWGDAFAFSGYLAIAREGRVVFGKGYGFADRARRIVPGPDTAFRIGSTSKSFTAIAILQLEARGVLREADPIRRWLPELPAFADGVTIHHCLTHTSGLPPLPNDPGLVAEDGKAHATAAAFARYADEKPLAAPGERFEYMNANFTILGAIVERASGASLEAYLREHVFVPAGMTRTTTVTSPPPADMAVGYDVTDDGALVVAKPIDYVLFGCGSIVSTANDLVAFDRALSDGRLLDATATRTMFTPERDVGGIVPIPARYALGWLVSEDAGHEVQWHPGGVNGFEASFARVSDERLTIVALANRFGDTTVMRSVARAAERAALVGEVPPPEVESRPGAVDAATRFALRGDYAVDVSTRATLRTKFTPDIVASWSSITIRADGERLFVVWADGRRAEIFANADGELFTRAHDFAVRVELDERIASAITLAPRQAGDGLTLRYLRLQPYYFASGECPKGMERIPGGHLDGPHGAYLAPFCLDATEVTVRDYAACARAGRCKPAPTTVAFEGIDDALRAKWNPTCNGARVDRADHPINCVDWSMASAYCESRGARLPSEAEWEWAARGGDEARSYPWGFAPPSGQLCWSGVTKRESTCAVASFAAGDARGAVHDLAGNVGEWTSSAEGKGYVAKPGGAWYLRVAERERASSREALPPWFRGPGMGIRCAK